MESSKNLRQEYEPKPASSSTSPAASASSRVREEAATAKEHAREFVDETSKAASHAYEQASQAASHAYEHASQAVGDTYQSAMRYSRNNPGTVILVAFGAGVGIGILLASGMPTRSRASRIAEPVIGAISQIARDFIR